jgi:hypothetical protein
MESILRPFDQEGETLKIEKGYIFGTEDDDVAVVLDVNDEYVTLLVIHHLFETYISNYINEHFVSEERFQKLSSSPNLYFSVNEYGYNTYTEDETRTRPSEKFLEVFSKEKRLDRMREAQYLKKSILPTFEYKTKLIEIKTETLLALCNEDDESCIRLKKCGIASKLSTMQQREATEFLHPIKREVCDNLVKYILAFCERTKADFHPGSNDMIRDVVHPSLYPYVQGETKTTWTSLAKRRVLGRIQKTVDRDIWNRPYEKSVYQWLPSEVLADKEGKCKITSYINNLPASEVKLHSAIEDLLTECWPHLETQWQTVCDTVLFDDDDFEHDGPPGAMCDRTKNLRDRNCQVITKIVDINIPSGEEIDGAWHVEGMSHEHIVCTADCIVHQQHVDAELFFKRRFLWEEAEGKYMEYSYQDDGYCMEEMEFLENGTIPIGKCATSERKVVCFPNSHIHKVIQKNSTDQPGRRMLVVFWLIDPEKRVVSTRDVPRQQGIMPEDVALEHRLKLMQERKLHKQNLNIRSLNLCEH